MSPRRLRSLSCLLWLVAACGDKGAGGADGSGSDGTSAGSSGSSATSAGSTGGTATAGSASGGSTGAATGAATTGGSGGSGSTSGAGFIQEPDGGVVGQCDPGLQDCPMDTKCSPYATMPGSCCVDSTQCVPIIGHKTAGEECTRTETNDDCEAGYFCTTQTSGSTGTGFCEQLCVLGDPASCTEGTCISYNDGVLPLCRVECDPLLQDCPQNGFGCYPGGDAFVCGKPAADVGMGLVGDGCYTARSCQPGLACLDAASLANCADTRCCSYFCDVTDGNFMCGDPAEQCVEWFTMGNAPPEYMNVGACSVPP